MPITKRRTFRKKPSSNKPKPNYNKLVTRGIGNVNVGMFSDQPFPARKHCKVVYSGSFNMSTNSLSTFGTQQHMTLNGLFDPDVTGTGHQPIGFDQLMAIYARFKVRSTRVELTWTNPSSDGVQVAYKLAPLNDVQNLTGLGYDHAQESRTVVVRPINNSGSQVVKQIFNVKGAMMCGLTHRQYADDANQLVGSSSQNPAKLYGFHAAICNPFDATVYTCQLSMRLIFDVDFYQRLTLPQS